MPPQWLLFYFLIPFPISADCGLLMPSYTQQSYFALRAFNVELASIKDGQHSSLSQRRMQQNDDSTAARISSLALQIRMQWWKDAIAEVYIQRGSMTETNLSQTVPWTHQSASSVSHWKSPIVRALAVAVEKHSLTRRFLERLVEARERDLTQNEPYETMKQVLDYSEESVSSLLYLQLELLGIHDDSADEVASYAGVGIGLVTALRSIPYTFERHSTVSVIPNELLPVPTVHRRELLHSILMAEHETADFGQGNPIPALMRENKVLWDDAIRRMTETAFSYLQEAQTRQANISPAIGRLALLPIVPALHYLEHLQHTARYNVLDPRLLDASSRRLGLLLRLGRSWFTNRI